MPPFQCFFFLHHWKWMGRGFSTTSTHMVPIYNHLLLKRFLWNTPASKIKTHVHSIQSLNDDPQTQQIKKSVDVKKFFGSNKDAPTHTYYTYTKRWLLLLLYNVLMWRHPKNLLFFVCLFAGLDNQMASVMMMMVITLFFLNWNECTPLTRK